MSGRAEAWQGNQGGSVIVLILVGFRELSRPLFGNDNPENEVGNEARKAAREQQNQKEHPKPEGPDPEECSQPSTDPADDTILPS
jgi:hypothetical protein